MSSLLKSSVHFTSLHLNSDLKCFIFFKTVFTQIHWPEQRGMFEVEESLVQLLRSETLI
jgi:hypothetical protein